MQVLTQTQNDEIIRIIGKLIMAHNKYYQKKDLKNDIFEAQLIDLHYKKAFVNANVKYKKILSHIIIYHYFQNNINWKKLIEEIIEDLNPNNEDDDELLSVIFDAYPELNPNKEESKEEAEEEEELGFEL